MLDYERPMVRRDHRTGLLYDTSSHFVWVGERTRDLDGAHIDFVSRIRNPIGVKLGPTTSPDEAIELCEKLNPDRIPGRLTLISRMGAEPHRPPPVDPHICAGTLLSREQYLYDVEQLGYIDGRLTPVSTMTPRDVDGWTEAIPARQAESVHQDDGRLRLHRLGGGRR